MLKDLSAHILRIEKSREVYCPAFNKNALLVNIKNYPYPGAVYIIKQLLHSFLVVHDFITK